jgi:hypothetical protein
LYLTAAFSYSGTFGFVGFGGTYIHRFWDAIAALTFSADWPKLAYFDRFDFSSGDTGSECLVQTVLSIQFEK